MGEFFHRRRGSDHIGKLDPEVLTSLIEAGAQTTTAITTSAIAKKHVRQEAAKKPKKVVVEEPAFSTSPQRNYGPYILGGAVLIGMAIVLAPKLMVAHAKP